MTDAFVLDAIRSPFGRFNGALAGVRPDDLGAHAVKAIVDRAPDLDPAAIDDVIFGNANGAGEDNRNVGRMSVLLAGLPTSVPSDTVNRLCGSSLDAAIHASRAVETGDADVILVGGVESMTRAPWVVLKPDRPFPAQGQTMYSTALGWRMVNPEMPDAGRSRSARARRRWPGSTRSGARRRTSSRCAATSAPPPPGTPASTTTG